MRVEVGAYLIKRDSFEKWHQLLINYIKRMVTKYAKNNCRNRL